MVVLKHMHQRGHLQSVPSISHPHLKHLPLALEPEPKVAEELVEDN